VALTESKNADQPGRLSLAGLNAAVRAWLADGSDRSITQRVASAAFVIRVFSAALIYGSQILFARWMGSFEFGIYVYVWTWVLLVGDLADLGLASAAQRFIPEYTRRKSFDLLRGFLLRSRWLAVMSAIAVAIVAASLVQLIKPWLADYVVIPLSIACITLPFYALMQIQDGIARSYDWIDLALVPPYVTRHLVMLALMATAFLAGFPTNAETAIAAVVVSFALTVVAQSVALNRRLARTVEAGDGRGEVKAWFAISLPILMVDAFYHYFGRFIHAASRCKSIFGNAGIAAVVVVR
jgi:O-antigen/teichoic acid export membrane protein